ncbi:acetyl-CoA C-acyltransferase [Dietzia alimentaria]|uniref:acetyl-CoA C-acyltransferase n=1 Tax=Dietzia alimentaria TaxID=665550 RepID=UPI00029ACF31|nr:acetyl-CoA C-acyltransferase [Dietzia alimentaria]
MSAARDVYILGSLRTPRGKGHGGGALAGVSPLSLVEQLLHGLTDRLGLDPAAVDEVMLGTATQTGAQGANLARTAVLTAGWPDTVAGQTVNRFCASGIDAVKNAAAMIAAEQAELVVAGGVESVSAVPMFADGGPLWSDPTVIETIGSVHMGIAADIGATELGLTRDELDAYGLRTQDLAAQAWERGFYDPLVLAVRGDDGEVALDRDELMRQTSREQLAQLEPAFAALGADGQDATALAHLPELDHIEHLHTRGTSPSLADGAGLVVVGTLDAAERTGLIPLARVVSGASVGSDPVRMLGAGQAAIERALARADLTPDQLDVVEFAEAFSAFCLKIQRELDLGDDRFNVNGGTIAMGHAFGATGAILTGQAVEQLRVGGGRYAAAAVSGAAGLGTALILERA